MRKEAQYSVQFVTTFAPPERIQGFGKISSEEIGGKLHTSEWALAGGSIEGIDSAFVALEVKMKHFRIYKSTDDQWCVVDGVLLQSAIQNNFTIQV